ncbi:MAG: acyltransferase [Bacteroidales bacterium]|jgi:acetyltransferase-like isoleucine patch superfamily enzyme|nr:acyltransferase [Bacteroidales bacterium]
MKMKLIFKVYTLLCRYFNNRYKKMPNISNSVKFSPEYPGFVVLINPKQIKIEEYTVINRKTHINPGNAQVIIGKYCHFGQGLIIYAFNHNFEFATKIPYDENNIYKDVIIGDFVWIGSNVTIVPGITMGEGAVVGAGSVVTKDVPSCAVVGGNPAKILKYRDVDIFNKLKQEGKFF